MPDTPTIPGKLIRKISIEGGIKAITGLHVGGTNTSISIGGVEASVLRNPITQQPYIPGSSLKGKMRTLLERVYVAEHRPVRKKVVADRASFGPGFGDIKAGPFNNIEHAITRLFGTTPESMRAVKKDDEPIGRLIVRDCSLTRRSAALLKDLTSTDMPFTEVKTEVAIDRVTSAAVPRQLERVPAGAIFRMRLILNIYDGDKEAELLSHLFEGLTLVQNDYLGGKGTRGSGQVAIRVRRVRYKDAGHYERGESWAEHTEVSIPEELRIKRPEAS